MFRKSADPATSDNSVSLKLLPSHATVLPSFQITKLPKNRHRVPMMSADVLNIACVVETLAACQGRCERSNMRSAGHAGAVGTTVHHLQQTCCRCASGRTDCLRASVRRRPGPCMSALGAGAGRRPSWCAPVKGVHAGA